MANIYLKGVIQIPSSLVITAITNSFNMACTVVVDPITEANTYLAGQLVRLFVPYSYGMFQANGLQGQVLSNIGSTITLNIDSRNFDVFSVPSGNTEQPASMAPAGSRNLELNNFTNQVPFQSLNNIGN